MSLYTRYGFSGSIKVIVSLIYTKMAFPQARLIRLPFDIRNKRFITIGKGFTTGFGCRIEALSMERENSNPKIVFGNDIQINDYVHIASGESVTIGNNVLIASKVFITDINHGKYSGEDPDSPMSPPNSRALSTNPVVIEDNVWLGENVCIMPGVTVGYGSIIGASAVVTKSIPSHSIAVGNPAKVIKTYDPVSKQWIPAT